MLPFLLFVSLSAVVMGMLNTKGKFFVPALSSSFFNLSSMPSSSRRSAASESDPPLRRTP